MLGHGYHIINASQPTKGRADTKRGDDARLSVLGFVGTGTITAAMVEGLRSSRLDRSPVLLSPRNDEVARRLAATYADIVIATDNQDVIDRSDIVILAVRPQQAEGVLKALRLRSDQKVISLIAGLDHEKIAECTGAVSVCRAIPLPFIAKGRGVTPVFPPEPVAIELFEALGGALPVPDIAAFDTFAALSALMGSYFGIAEIATHWARLQGLPDEQSRPYVAALFGNLGDILREHPTQLEQLRIDHSTRGGLNEQMFADFQKQGGAAALMGALEGVLDRIKGR